MIFYGNGHETQKWHLRLKFSGGGPYRTLSQSAPIYKPDVFQLIIYVLFVTRWEMTLYRLFSTANSVVISGESSIYSPKIIWYRR